MHSHTSTLGTYLYAYKRSADTYEHVRISACDDAWHRYTGYIMHRGFYLV